MWHTKTGGHVENKAKLKMKIFIVLLVSIKAAATEK